MRSTMLRLLLAGSLGLAAGAGPALADPLSPVPDPLLRELLNGMTVLAERQDPVHIRVIALRHFGDCGGAPDPLTCPTTEALVAVSEAGQFPRQQLFRLPSGFGWHFLDWKTIPKSLDAPESFIVFEMKQDTIEKASGPKAEGDYAWGAKNFEVGVNLTGGYVQPTK